MKIYFKLTVFLLFAIGGQSFAQTSILKSKMKRIIASKNAVVGIAVKGSNPKDTLSINGNRQFPLQSVFKFHIALAVLSQIDHGKFSLNQKIKIDKKDLLPDLYSLIRDRMLGGPQAVEKYCKDAGIKDVSIKINEEQQQANWDLQFQNWTTPKAANAILELFYLNKNNLLSKKSHRFIWKVMRETKTGENRLRGQLPEKTTVAHKTGSSGTNRIGITAAVNDIGIVFLPDGSSYFISVFVTESTENAETNEKIIADLNKAAWEYFRGNK